MLTGLMRFWGFLIGFFSLAVFLAWTWQRPPGWITEVDIEDFELPTVADAAPPRVESPAEPAAPAAPLPGAGSESEVLSRLEAP